MEFRVIETFQLDGKLFVIYDPNGPLNNLYAYDEEGERLWIAENRRPRDPFTGFVGDGHSLKAATWDCFCCTLDPETGKIITSEFTK